MYITEMICTHNYDQIYLNGKVDKIKEESLDLIPSPSPTVKIQIIGRKVYLRQ